MGPQQVAAWTGLACAVAALGVAVLGGPEEPPKTVWIWASQDGAAPTSDGEAREVYDRPDGRRLSDFDARGDAPAGAGQPMGVSLRAPAGLRGKLAAAIGIGRAEPGPWLPYRTTARSDRGQIGTFWEYRRSR